MVSLKRQRKSLTCVMLTLAVFFVIDISRVAQAESDWLSVTIDNDLFVNSDNGYTNGLFFSWFDLSQNRKPEPGLLASTLLWSLSGDDPLILEVSAKTVGQVMSTPSDISLENPPQPPDDMPYAGLLFYSDSYIRAYQDHAEKISVTIGVIGKYSLAEDSQKLVHSITGSDKPKGWDTQLDDEIVFQLIREWVWKSWTSESGSSDILLGGGVALGTISSSIDAAVMFRYGRHLSTSYASVLLIGSKASNPVAVDSGWYLFAGAKAGYLGNHIFLDGNTFDDDESMDYSKDQLGVSFGLAYSWKDLSITFAFYDMNVNDSSEYSEFGTLTLAWQNY